MIKMKSDKEINPKNFSSRWTTTVRCVQVSLYWSTRHLMHADEWRSSPDRWFHSIPNEEEEEESLRRLKRWSERTDVSKHSNTSKMIIIKPSFIRFASSFKIILLSDIWNYRFSMVSFVRIFIDNDQQNENDSSFQLKINDKCTLRLSRTTTAREINCVFFLFSSRLVSSEFLDQISTTMISPTKGFKPDFEHLHYAFASSLNENSQNTENTTVLAMAYVDQSNTNSQSVWRWW